MNSVSMHLNSLDYIIMGVVALSIIISFFRGFLKEAISLATWFLAFVAALKFAPWVSNDILHSAISHETSRYIASCVLIFLGVMIIGIVVNKLAGTLVTISGLWIFDRVLGIVFGAARGLLIAIIGLVIIQAGPFDNTAFAKESQLTPYFQPIVTQFESYLPKEVQHVSQWMKQMSDQPLTSPQELRRKWMNNTDSNSE